MPQFFESAVMTNAGSALVARSMAEDINIEFVSIVVGNGSYTNTEKEPAALKQRTALKSLQASYAPSVVIRENENAVRISALITNVDPVSHEAVVTSGFYINEVGVMARPSDDATEAILFSVSVTTGTQGDYMPAYTGDNPAQIVQGYVTAVSNDSVVTLTAPVNPYALANDLQALADAVDERITEAEITVTELTKSVSENWQGKGYNLIPYPYLGRGQARGYNFDVNNDGSIHVTGSKTTEGTAQYYFFENITDSILIRGKKYRLSGCPLGGSASTYRLRLIIYANAEHTVTKISPLDYGDGVVFTVPTDAYDWRLMIDLAGEVGTSYDIIFKPMIVEVSEDGTYPTEYQRYAMGNVELTDFKADNSKVITLEEKLTQLDSDVVNLSDEVGINLWDEEWKNGYYADGNFIVNNNYICSADLCEIKGNLNVYVYTASSVGRVVLSFYDVNKSFISILPARNEIVTTPSNACYFTIYHEAEQTTYNHDICINVSNPSINGTYYPFRGLRRDISENLTHQAELLVDNYMTPVFGTVHNSSDGRSYTKRFGRIDLSTVDYGGANGVFYNGLSRKKGSACNGYCSKYPVYTTYASYAAASGNRIGFAEDGTTYYVDSNYSDVASFKQSLQGVYLYYELETPETYNLVDYASTEDVITDKWASWKTYAVGDYCIKDNQLYKCLTQHSNIAPPNDSYWSKTSLGGEITNKSEGGMQEANSNGVAHVTWSKHNTPPSNIAAIVNAEGVSAYVSYNNLDANGCDFFLWSANGSRLGGFSVRWSAFW